MSVFQPCHLIDLFNGSCVTSPQSVCFSSWGFRPLHHLSLLGGGERELPLAFQFATSPPTGPRTCKPKPTSPAMAVRAAGQGHRRKNTLAGLHAFIHVGLCAPSQLSVETLSVLRCFKCEAKRYRRASRVAGLTLTEVELEHGLRGGHLLLRRNLCKQLTSGEGG